MQLLATEDDYFIKSVRTILKCSRSTAQLSVTSHEELASLEDFQVFGNICHFFGKITVQCISYLILVIDSTEVAFLPHCKSTIRRIDKVCALPVLADGYIHSRIFEKSLVGITKFKNHPKKIVKFVSDKVNVSSKRIDDLVRFINESGNFYFSFQADLTLSIQRRAQNPSSHDLRFFWNKELLNDFFDKDGNPLPSFNDWIIPVIYGYIAQSNLTDFAESGAQAKFTLISRRSVRRAGVRYLRRGIDPTGDVANFVETESIISASGHCLSFVQIRGSVPIFWSQRGYRFRPPLSIDKGIEESLPIFKNHMYGLIAEYGSPIVIVNLVEQSGRELCLGTSYLQHVLELNSPDVALFSFDYHRNCKSLRLNKIADLIGALKTALMAMGFCWLDKEGTMVYQQKGVVRTNCVDCLDRTNVVQSAICQAVTLYQATKLGLVQFIAELGEEDASTRALKTVLQEVWANHGDSVSKQYAGTNALKSDVTRGGQRKLVGLVKDSYNSASRYYRSHIYDAQRQWIIDTLLSGSDATVTIPMDDNKNAWSEDDGAINQMEDEETEDERDPNAKIGPDGVRFMNNPEYENQEPEVVVDEWAMDDALKQRISESRSRIVMFENLRPIP
ncbi:sacI homology domain-containing protein [Ditylenchus destructor]|nr:sacI homology domain-containing protein [Ditylenchus destructor]